MLGCSIQGPENLSAGNAPLNSSSLKTLLTLNLIRPISFILLHLDIETAPDALSEVGRIKHPPC